MGHSINTESAHSRPQSHNEAKQAVLTWVVIEYLGVKSITTVINRVVTAGKGRKNYQGANNAYVHNLCHPTNIHCVRKKMSLQYSVHNLNKNCPIFTCVTLCVERDLVRATCPSIRYSRYCIKMEIASVMISSPSHSPMISLSGEVWLFKKFSRGHPQRGRFLRVWWIRTGVFCDFSTYKPPYLRNGTRYDNGYYWTLIGNCISAIDWYQNQWPWMTLNWP